MPRGLMLCLLACCAPTLAGACSFVPDTSLCGLPLDATPARFSAVLGEPAGTLQFGPLRQGLLYGGQLLIIFEAGRAVEVQSWARAEPEFLAQLKAPGAASTRLTLGSFTPWSRSRQQLDLALENFPLLSADTRMQTRALGHSRLLIRYRAEDVEADKIDNPAQYRVDQLQLILRPQPAGNSSVKTANPP